MNSETFELTKLEGARRQLTEAIRLFFQQRDILCVHTLCGAAVTVLNDLAKREGRDNPFRESDLIHPDHKAEWIQAINSAQNFLKHADSDHEVSFTFRPEATPFLMLEGLDIFGALGRCWLPETITFFAWFGAAHPRILKDGALKEKLASHVAEGNGPENMEAWNAILTRMQQLHDRGEWPPPVDAPHV